MGSATSEPDFVAHLHCYEMLEATAILDSGVRKALGRELWPSLSDPCPGGILWAGERLLLFSFGYCTFALLGYVLRGGFRRRFACWHFSGRKHLR